MDYHSRVNQRILADFVRKNVIYCISELVGELSKDMKYDEMIMDLSMVTDWEYLVDDNDLCVYYSHEMEGYVYIEDDGEESEVFDTWHGAATAACEHYNIDTDVYREVFEYWLVDRWFGNQLLEHGEPVIFEFFGLEAVWGRCTTGQAILLDNVVGEIAEELEILEGQKHSCEDL